MKGVIAVLLAVTGISAVVIIIVMQTPGSGLIDYSVRVLALFGYFAFFTAVVSSSFMKQLYRYFGKPFIKVHHAIALTAFALMLMHPAAAVIQYGTPAYLLPQTSSVSMFLYFAGAPALYFVAAAVVTAFLSRIFRKSWRYIHWLNYIAFFLVTVHGLMIGTDFQLVPVRITVFIMAATAAILFVHRRLRQFRRA